LRCGVVSTPHNHQSEGSSLVGCPRLIIQYIHSQLPSTSGDPLRNPGMRNTVVTGTHIRQFWWRKHIHNFGRETPWEGR